MNKETEEIVLFFIIGLVALKLLTGASSSANSALQMAKINSTTDVAYAGDASGLIASLASDWS